MSGLKFSPLIVGAMRLGQWGAKYSTDEYERFIDQCLDINLSDFDHADIYGGHTTEEEFGAVLKRRPDLKQKVEITTKCGIMYPSEQRTDIKVKHYDLSKAHIIKSAERSLSDLGVESIKLLLLHRPDYKMQAEEVAAAFDALKQSGKVQYFGVSNFTPTQYAVLKNSCNLLNNQIEFSLQQPQLMLDDSLHYFNNEQVQLTAWSPLGGGAIFKEDNDSALKKALSAMAEKYSCSVDQLMYAWIFGHPQNIVPVTGSSKFSRIESALAAKDIRLSREDWYALLESSRGEKVA